MKKTSYKYNWLYLADRFYGIKNSLITVRIVYTMFPHIYKKNNRIIEQYKNSSVYNMQEFKDYINNSKQTRNDRRAIIQFYNNLNNYFDIINTLGGVVITFSYTIFNKDSENSRLDNYFMFSEIKNIFDNSNISNRLLCEWYYDNNNYTVIPYNTNIKKLLYIGIKENNDCEYLNINNNNNILSLDYSSSMSNNDNINQNINKLEVYTSPTSPINITKELLLSIT